MLKDSHHVPTSRHEHDIKAEKFRLGKYSCKVPPVFTGYWSVNDWIKYIDREGEWK